RLAVVCALSRRATLKHSSVAVVIKIREMMTVKCRVRTLGSQLMRLAHSSQRKRDCQSCCVSSASPEMKFPARAGGGQDYWQCSLRAQAYLSKFQCPDGRKSKLGACDDESQFLDSVCLRPIFS